MTKRNLRHWIRPLLFFLLLAALIQLFSYIPVQRSHRKNGNYWPYFYQELPKKSVNLFYLGNSHSKCTFIPEIIDDILGTRSVHVNTSGESNYQTIYEYREVLRYQDPDYVIIETFPIYTGLDQGSLKPWNLSFFYAMPLGTRKLIYSLDYLKGYELLYFFLPYTSNHAIWKDPMEVYARIHEEIGYIRDRLSPEWKMDFPDRGYTNYLKSLVPGQINLKDYPPAGGCPVPDMEGRLTTTEEILNINRKNPEGLLFIESPQFINDYANCRPVVEELIESYGVRYEILLDQPVYPLLWFGDKQHLTQFGATIASVTTAELLAERMGIPANSEELAYYKKYFFREYILDLEDDAVTLTLIPYEATSIADMDFRWEMFVDNQSIYKTAELKGGNIFHYPLPETGKEIFIHIMIHDPNGDYYLRGGFQFERP